MSDESPENQEFFASNEVNDFHSSVDARTFSADFSSNSSGTETSSEKTLTNTASHFDISILAGGTATTAVVVTSVLILSPTISSLPKISSLEVATTAVSVSYSFSCAYSGSGSLLVRLTSAFDEKANTISLPEKDSVSSSSVSAASLSGSSSSASSTNEATFAGIFDALTSGTNYVLTIQTPLTGNTYTTLSQQNVTTSTKTISLSFDQVAVDYEHTQLTYLLKSDDPSSLPGMNELHLLLTGRDSKGLAHEEETPLSGVYGDTQSASLAGFMKGYYLRLALLGANENNTAGDPAKKYAEMALYY
jgi:hypothetical protein